MGMVTKEKKSFLDTLQQATQIGTQIAGVIQQGQQIKNASRSMDIQEGYLKNAQEQAKVNLEKWGMEKQALEQQFEVTRLKNYDTGNQVAARTIYDIIDSASKSEKPEAALKVAFSNPGTIEHLARAYKLANKPFGEADLAQIQQGAPVAIPALKKMNSAEGVLGQLLSAPDAKFDAAAAQKTLKEYFDNYSAVSHYLPDSVSDTFGARKDYWMKAIADKNKQFQDAQEFNVKASMMRDKQEGSTPEDKDFSNTLSIISGIKGSQNTDFGKASSKLADAAKIEALWNDPEVIKNKSVTVDSAMALARMLTGSSRVAESIIHELDPAKGSFADFNDALEWVQSRPREVITAAQSKNFQAQVMAEKRAYTKELLNKFEALKEKHRNVSEDKKQQLDATFQKAFPGAVEGTSTQPTSPPSTSRMDILKKYR